MTPSSLTAAPFPRSPARLRAAPPPGPSSAPGARRDRRLLPAAAGRPVGLLRRHRAARRSSAIYRRRASGTCRAGERLPWYLFALGLLGQVAGDAIFAVYEVQLNREPPSPSIADVFYLGGYPLLALGVLLVLRELGGQTSRAAVLDTLVVFCGVALVQWVFFIDPYNHMHFGTEAARLVAMAYPAVDVLLLVAFAQLLVGPGGRTRGVPPAARERRALGRRRRDLRPEPRQLPGRRAGSTRSGSARTSSGRPPRSTRRWRASPQPDRRRLPRLTRDAARAARGGAR